MPRLINPPFQNFDKDDITSSIKEGSKILGIDSGGEEGVVIMIMHDVQGSCEEASAERRKKTWGEGFQCGNC